MNELVKTYVDRYNELAEKYGFPSTTYFEISETDLAMEVIKLYIHYGGAVLAENELYNEGLINKEDVSCFVHGL